MHRQKLKSLSYIFPIIGIGLFVLLYIYSAAIYPGGSQFDECRLGFDWFHNYWCNLTNSESINGQINPSRPFAVLAMFILCFSLLIVFVRFSQIMVKDNLWRKLILRSSCISMFSAFFIYSDFHDQLTVLASVFGGIALIGVIRVIMFNKSNILKYFGLICLVFMAINNVIYYTSFGLFFLPVLQKITMVVVFIWVLRLNKVIRQYQLSHRNSELK